MHACDAFCREDAACCSDTLGACCVLCVRTIASLWVHDCWSCVVGGRLRNCVVHLQAEVHACRKRVARGPLKGRGGWMDGNRSGNVADAI